MSSTETIMPTTDAAAADAGHGATRHAYDVGLLLLRVMVGITMAAHGSQKLFGWFGGGGIHGTGEFFAGADTRRARPWRLSPVSSRRSAASR